MCYQAWLDLSCKHVYGNTIIDLSGSMFTGYLSILPCTEVDKINNHSGYVIIKKICAIFNLFTDYFLSLT